MRHAWRLALALLLVAGFAAAQQPYKATKRPTCRDGSPQEIFIVDASSATDCDATGGGSTEAHCCCLDGTWASCGGSGGSGDITDVWGCTTGNCNAITGASGDSLDAGSADSSRPGTRSTSLPSDCYEGQLHQDTNSGGSEAYVCTVGDGPGGSADTWTKLAGTTTLVSEDAAPYGQYDPHNPPASCAVCEEWTDDTATQTWAWENQESSTETLTMDGALLIHPTDLTGLAVRYLTNGPDGSAGDFVISVRVTPQASTLNNLAGIFLLATGTAASPTLLHTCSVVATSADNLRVQHQSWTSYTSAATTLGTFTGYSGAVKTPWSIYLQLRYDSATKIATCWASNDGFVYISTGYTGPFAGHPTTTMGMAVASFTNSGADNGGLFHYWRARTDAGRNLSGE